MSHLEPPAALSALDFLIGRFQGEGNFARGETTFAKQVVGRWEVGGHFLSLSMTASYRVKNAIADVHHAMAVVGVDAASGDLEARVFTDGGQVLEHRLRVELDRILFRDRVPHETRAQQARKILLRTPYGYDEMLEVDRRGEGFETYSVVRLRRTSA
jgi:hypothetical protein